MHNDPHSSEESGLYWLLGKLPDPRTWPDPQLAINSPNNLNSLDTELVTTSWVSRDKRGGRRASWEADPELSLKKRGQGDRMGFVLPNYISVATQLFPHVSSRVSSSQFEVPRQTRYLRDHLTGPGDDMAAVRMIRIAGIASAATSARPQRLREEPDGRDVLQIGRILFITS